MDNNQTIKTTRYLYNFLNLNLMQDKIDQACQAFAFKITTSLAKRIVKNNLSDPILLQFMPHELELQPRT